MAGEFDPEAALRMVIAGTGTWFEGRGADADHSSGQRSFARYTAMVCGWAPDGTAAALLAAVSDPDGPYGLHAPQAEALAEATRQAEALRCAVAALDGAEADHDRRIAAATTVIGYLPNRSGPNLEDEPVWHAAHDAIWGRTEQLLSAQPAGVRQTLFDAWTVPEEKFTGQIRLIRYVLSPGGLDGSGWLDRVGGHLHLRFHDWSWNLRRWTWESIVASEQAGRTHAPALATWRRSRADLYLGDADDAGESMWPVPNVGEPWADRAVADIEAMPEHRRSAWHALLAHCLLVGDKARPTAAWRKQARVLLDAVGAEEFTGRLDDWLELVGLARSRPLRMTTCCSGHFANCPPRLPDRHNVALLCGLLWTRAMMPPSAPTLSRLGRIAERACRKVPGHGPASPKLANAAVAVLDGADDPAALAHLARLASRLTYKGTLNLVSKALTTRAEALGVSREDVEEMALPGFGLPLADTLGDHSYEVEVRGVDAVVVWRDAGGKVLKAPPASVRADHGEELKDLKATVKDIGVTLIATRDRLERLLRRDREWATEQWRERLLDHPLAGTLARRLIWTVDGVACCWAGDALRTVDGSVLEPAGGATVRLWHPVGQEPAVVRRWREFLAEHGISQPFKQAHREQYVLADAERATGTYSNRFAAHIVLQSRLNALLARRGWSYVQHRNDGSAYDPPGLALPEWGLRAELGVAGIDTRDDLMVFETMATDQLRITRTDGTPVPLEQVPAVVLSEVMRDVDLFVAVAGVGSDPEWYDGGPAGRYRDYWAANGLGALSVSGQTRREVLAALIPRLAVADRCTVTERYVEVRGDLHTYRIHCGSGNVLIAPDDRYLCIVPESAKPAKEPRVFLPFEGDSRLSDIISKALLLAADKKIKDPVILRQL